jgi:hypothetical protein
LLLQNCEYADFNYYETIETLGACVEAPLKFERGCAEGLAS